MASGEENLRQRWGDVYHNTAEYQAAQRADAATRSNRDAQARAAISAALARGDAQRAAALQSQLVAQQVAERTGRGGGRVAAADEFQNSRVADYLDQQRERGPARLAEALQSPTRAVANGPGYYQSLLEPDFSNDFPYMTVRPIFGPSVRGTRATRGAGGAPAPQTQGGGQTLGGEPATNAYGVSQEMIDANAPTRAMLDSRAQDLELATQRRVRRDQALRNTLPSDLLETYERTLKDGAWTGKEFGDFINATPEQQYAQLRTRQAAIKNYRPGPTEEKGGTITIAGATNAYSPDNSPAVQMDYLRDVDTLPLGTQSLTDLPTITRLGVGGIRPRTSLATPALSFKYAPGTTF